MPHAILEHGASPRGRRLARHRLTAAALVAAAEGALVLTGVLPWYVVALAAVATTVLYLGRLRSHASPDLRAVAWVAATSQLLVVMVPLLAVFAVAVAVGLVIVFSLAALAALLLSRR